jgi:protein-arginine kinase activator protein McsA
MCERCHQETAPTHRISSDLMVVDVCDSCAEDAVHVIAITVPGTPGEISVWPIKEAAG